MKLSTKIILPLILISALLILLAGCFGVPADESPGYTPGTITGIIASPCCSTSAEPVSETCCIAPEYWCFYCQKTWSLQDGIEVVLTYGEDEVATVFTNKDGEFTFTNVDPGKNYVVTAYCPDFDDNRPLVKDVALELIEGGSFDTKITDLVSTSLGLVVDFLVYYTEWGPEDISLDAVLEDRPNFPNFPKFKALIYEVRRVVENCEVNLLTDDDVLYATCRAAEEISGLDIGCGAGYTPPPPPPPGPCDGNIAPTIGSVLLDGTEVFVNGTVDVVVGTPYVITVNASDDGIKDPLTYSASVNGVNPGPFSLNQITITPTVVDTYTVYVSVNDGCDTTSWGPVTVDVHDECYNNTAPSLTMPADDTVDPNSGPYTWSVTASDDGIKDPLSFTLVSVVPTPANNFSVDATSGEISWDPTCDDIIDGDTTFTVTVEVTDGCEPVQGSFKVTLNSEPCDVINYLLIRGYHSASKCEGLQKTLEVTSPPDVSHNIYTGLWLYEQDHTPNVKHINFIARYDGVSTLIEYRYRYRIHYRENPFPSPESWVDWTDWSSSGTTLGEDTYGYGFESDCMRAPSNPANPAYYCYQFELEIRVNGNTNTYLVHVD